MVSRALTILQHVRNQELRNLRTHCCPSTCQLKRRFWGPGQLGINICADCADASTALRMSAVCAHFAESFAFCKVCVHPSGTSMGIFCSGYTVPKSAVAKSSLARSTNRRPTRGKEENLKRSRRFQPMQTSVDPVADYQRFCGDTKLSDLPTKHHKITNEKHQGQLELELRYSATATKSKMDILTFQKKSYFGQPGANEKKSTSAWTTTIINLSCV